ncbi:hypothetical protein R6Q57_006360 [Mikania cordata]
MSAEDVQSFCKEYEYHILEHLRPRASSRGETAVCRAGEVSIYVHSFRACGVRYPFSSFLYSVLERHRVHFSQFHTLGFLCIVHFELSCRTFGGMSNVPLFRRFYHFRTDGDWFTFERRRILKKASRAMEFVSVDADISIPLSTEIVVIPSPEQSLLEDISNTDDDIVPLAKILKNKVTDVGESSKSGTQRVLLRFRFRSHAQMQPIAEASSAESPLMHSKRKASAVVIQE